ncbi:MAG: hypothetical protein ACLU18_11615 [Bacteroides thetaiotaomicron]
MGKYLDRIIVYANRIILDRPGAMQQIDDFMKELHPVAFRIAVQPSDTSSTPHT